MSENIWLQVNKYDDLDNCTMIQFEVSKEWLQRHIEQLLEEFLDEYTSDESSLIYDIAELEDAILNEIRS